MILRWILILAAALMLVVPGPNESAFAGQTSSKKTASKSASSKTGLIDINSASADELKSLTGIGDAYSAKIIKGRPYANKAQLVSRGIIPQATYNKIKDQIIAKQK